MSKTTISNYVEPLLEAPSAGATVQRKTAKTWAYDGADGERDLRIDFMRGLVMLVLITVHIELFSAYNFLTWERIGVVSGAEGFVILSGMVVGMAYKRRIIEKGFADAAWKLLDRAVTLWKVNVVAVLAIGLVSLQSLFNVSSIMTFVDRGSGQVYPLFPKVGTDLHVWFANAFMLRATPHQLQILGLYVCLLALTPLALYLMYSGRTKLLLGLSWIAYFYNWTYASMPTGAQFEYAFPLLTWQLLYFHGQAIGFHRKKVMDFMSSRQAYPLLAAVGIVFLAFFFFAQNTPNANIPSFARLKLIPPDFFGWIYGNYMQKGSLGLLRVIDDACVLVAVFAVLTRLWEPIQAALGWFFIPIGQASLYVFAVHIAFVALVANILPYGFPNPPHILTNTVAHTLVLAAVWTMVRYKVFFRWIPR